MIGERLTTRAAAVAERRCRAVAAELAHEARSVGVEATASGGAVTLSGRGLSTRWLADPCLRFLGRAR